MPGISPLRKGVAGTAGVESERRGGSPSVLLSGQATLQGQGERTSRPGALTASSKRDLGPPWPAFLEEVAACAQVGPPAFQGNQPLFGSGCRLLTPLCISTSFRQLRQAVDHYSTACVVLTVNTQET